MLQLIHKSVSSHITTAFEKRIFQDADSLQAEEGTTDNHVNREWSPRPA